jgi:hypothetical protein
MKTPQGNNQQSLILDLFSRMIEWGYRWCNVSRLLPYDPDPVKVFYRIEVLMFALTWVCAAFFLTITVLPQWIAVGVALVLAQRVVEFVVIYSRNFIFTRGRIFSHFHDPAMLGQWLILMFGLSLTQVMLAFATWYQLLSHINPEAFSQPLDLVGSLYFSFITFLTIGYGDIVPLTELARILVIFQAALSFYVIVIVINGMISLHFTPVTLRKLGEEQGEESKKES